MPRSSEDFPARDPGDISSRHNAELSEFAAVAAHDLRSPLQAVSGFANLLSELYGPQLDDRAREFIAWIVNGAARMTQRLEGLLEYARVGTTETRVMAVDLNLLVDSVVERLDLDMGSRGPVLRRVPLPVVAGDPDELELLLYNLIANAWKFVADGTVPEVVLGSRSAPSGWVVTVDDNGIGIAAEDRERVFGMFKRLGPQDQYEGSGVGLAICERIIERMGERIWIEDNPAGRGSRFCFTVPAHDRVETPVTPAPGGSDSRDREVLVVEAARNLSDILDGALASFVVHRVAGPEDAWAALMAGRPSCVLIDLSDGQAASEFVAETVARFPAVPVVVAASGSDPASGVAALQQGAQGVVVKETTGAAELARAIGEAMSHSRIEADLSTQAKRDRLTGLPSRELALYRLSTALRHSARTGECVAVLYVYLAAFGSDRGSTEDVLSEASLVDVGLRLRRSIRPQDTAARVGAAEFLLICDGLRPPADEAVGRIRDRVATAVVGSMGPEGATQSRQVGVGVAVSTTGAELPEDLVRAARAHSGASQR